MSYLVTCTFDLKNPSGNDYQNAYADLQKMGLKRVVVSNQGREVVAPTTMTIGEFTGTGASAVCADVRDKVQAAFRARRFNSEIFVVTGGDWAWASGAAI